MLYTVQKLLNSWRKKNAHKSDAYGQKAVFEKIKNIFLISKQKKIFKGKFFVMIHLHNKIFFADLKTHKQKS